MFCAVSTGVSKLAMMVQRCYRHEQMHIIKALPDLYNFTVTIFRTKARRNFPCDNESEVSGR
jgi:hypothetical protein